MKNLRKPSLFLSGELYDRVQYQTRKTENQYGYKVEHYLVKDGVMTQEQIDDNFRFVSRWCRKGFYKGWKPSQTASYIGRLMTYLRAKARG